jgi:hypothetical protein
MKIDSALICRAQTRAGKDVHRIAGLIALYQSFGSKRGRLNTAMARKFERELRRMTAGRF